MSKESEKIAKAVGNILKGETSVRKKQKKKLSSEKQIFIDIIEGWEEALRREVLLVMQAGVDLGAHNNLYYFIISKLITFKFGDEISELIHFYIYEKNNGAKLKNDKGLPLKIDKAEDLWNLIEETKKKLENKK